MSNAKSVVSLASLAVVMPAALPALAVIGALFGLGALLSRKSGSGNAGDAPEAGDAGPVTAEPVRRIGLFGIRRQPETRPVIAQAVARPDSSLPSEPVPAAEIAPALATPASQPSEAQPAAVAQRGSVTADDLRAVLAGGPMKRKDAVAALRERTGCGKTKAYAALSAGSTFSDFLTEDEGGRIGIRA